MTKSKKKTDINSEILSNDAKEKLKKFSEQLNFNTNNDMVIGDYNHKIDIHVSNNKSEEQYDEFWLNGTQLMKLVLNEEEIDKVRTLLSMITIVDDAITINFGENRKVDIFLRNDGIDDIFVNGNRIVNKDN